MLGRSANRGFRSDEARRRYLAVYHGMRSLSPEPDVVHEVPTEFGTVRAYQHGPSGGDPIVLVHCLYGSSVVWSDQVPALVGDFTVYTVDMLGQPGASSQSKAMRTASQCVRCINDIFDGLNVHDVHLVGHSYGGWLAFQTAARTPGRLASVTLVDPANTVARISGQFWRTAGVLTHSRSERVQRVVGGMLGNPAPGSRVDTLAQLVRVGAAEFAALGTPYPKYPRNSLLRSVPVPVQVLLAGNTIHDSGKGIERIRTVVPAWRHRLWPAASHALPWEVPDEVNACISDFAREHR